MDPSTDERPGRNDPCHCGSGRKYKQCCLEKDEAATRAAHAEAVAATVLGCAFAWGGLVFPPLKPLYDYAWFVGFAVAFAVYAVLMRGAPVAGPAAVPDET